MVLCQNASWVLFRNKLGPYNCQGVLRKGEAYCVLVGPMSKHLVQWLFKVTTLRQCDQIFLISDHEQMLSYVQSVKRESLSTPGPIRTMLYLFLCAS